MIELEAKDSSRYDFEEATSPSLLSPSAAVIVNHAEDCDEPLAQAITDHCRNPHGEADGSLVIVSHNGSAKGKRLIDSLTRLHAVLEDIPKLDKPQARLNFTLKASNNAAAPWNHKQPNNSPACSANARANSPP